MNLNKLIALLVILLVVAGLLYFFIWPWFIALALYYKIPIIVAIVCGVLVAFVLPNNSTGAAQNAPATQFTLPLWFVAPFAKMFRWAVYLGVGYAVVVFILPFAFVKAKEKIMPPPRLWKTGVIDPNGFEQYKLAITDAPDYQFALPACARTRLCNPHRVRRTYPDAHVQGDPNVITEDIAYSDYEVAQGIGTNPHYTGNTSYMNTFYMFLDPSTGLTKDTVVIWVLDQNKVASR